MKHYIRTLGWLLFLSSLFVSAAHAKPDVALNNTAFVVDLTKVE